MTKADPKSFKLLFNKKIEFLLLIIPLKKRSKKARESIVMMIHLSV